MEHIGTVISTDIKLGIDAEFLETLYEFRKDYEKDYELDIYYNTDTKLFEYTIKEDVYDSKGISSTVVKEAGSIGVGLATIIATMITQQSICKSALGGWTRQVGDAAQHLYEIGEQTI
jgi:hypothetical protein